MITLIFLAGELDRLREEIWNDDVESAAILLCLPVRAGSAWRLVVREMHVVPDNQYEERSAIAVKVNPAFGLPVEKKASVNGWTLVYCHTHPHQEAPAQFSHIDDFSETALAKYADRRSPDVPHCALLFAKGSLAARRLGTNEAALVSQLNSPPLNTSVSPSHSAESVAYDRQIRAFGTAGQEALSRLRVAIVGLGGTGSVVAQQLAHLGVSNFLLVDRDTIEETNLNRTIGSTPSDIGTAKVAVADRMVKSIRSDAVVEAVIGDVVDEPIASKLISSDFIFCCTDSHASRHVINQISYQYVLSAIDLGVAIDATGPKVRFAGHAKALLVGEPCLWCLGNLDARQIREEMMTPEQRATDPYVLGNVGIIQPSVISINSTLASTAVTMFLSMVTGLDAPARFLVYDGNRQRLAPVSAQSDPACNFCGPNSPAGGGDAYPLPVRRNAAR
jgi:molybdopterin/thiamine biosynthesis adenylyltransferase